jgi:16S rRNA processing protein RimM
MTNFKSDFVTVGKVIGVWGLQGFLKVFPLSDNVERFSKGSTLYLSEVPMVIKSIRNSGKIILVKFDLIDNRGKAEQNRGKLLQVPSCELTQLPVDTYYYNDILGSSVYDESDHLWGIVTQILKMKSNDVYVVERAGFKDLLIPALRGIILSIDSELLKIIIRRPSEWIR